MIDYQNSRIQNFIFHKISQDESSNFLNQMDYPVTNEDEDLFFKKIFLKPFLSASSVYEFSHDINLELNPLFKLSQAVFQKNNFIEGSQKIHQHLSSVSKHPNIKDGELFVVKFSGIEWNNSPYEALGVYKIENKESFIEMGAESMKIKKGIGPQKLDKACLILFTEEPYTVLVIDNNRTETEYWNDDFINSRYKKDKLNQTNQFLHLAKTFVTKQIPSEFEVNKTEQIDLLNRSVAYFKQNETFNQNEFEQEVFQEEQLIDSFRKFDENYREEKGFDSSESFEISPEAVKKQARIFKSVLKLDKNFHIYIHGDRELIEKGTDDSGRKFYKIYYQEEN